MRSALLFGSASQFSLHLAVLITRGFGNNGVFLRRGGDSSRRAALAYVHRFVLKDFLVLRLMRCAAGSYIENLTRTTSRLHGVLNLRNAAQAALGM